MATGVRLEQLGWAFGADRDHGFTAWTLATPDPLEAVLAPGYFRHCSARFRPGDLVFCATGQQGGASRVPSDTELARHRCLLLVTRIGAGEVEVRVAQDWGSPAASPMVSSGGARASGRARRARLEVQRAGCRAGPRPGGKRKMGLRELAGASPVRRRPRPAGMATAGLATAGRARVGGAPRG